MSLENSLDNKKDVALLKIHSIENKTYLVIDKYAVKIPSKKVTITDNNPEMDFNGLQKLCLSIDKDIKDMMVTYEDKNIELPSVMKSEFIDYLKNSLYMILDNQKFVDKMMGKDIKNIVGYEDYIIGKKYKSGSPAIVVDEGGSTTCSTIYLGDDLFVGKGDDYGPMAVSKSQQRELFGQGTHTKIAIMKEMEEQKGKKKGVNLLSKALAWLNTMD